MNGIELKQIIESFYPKDLAYEWDNVGLQIGTLNKEINVILLTLDLRMEVIDEAISKKVDLIIVHHPLIFSPIKNINTDTYKGKLIEKLIKNEITLYVAHTNFDISNKGMNLILANMLNLKNQEILDYTTDSEGLGRIGEVNEMNMEDSINFVKKTFKVKTARFIGDIKASVNRIAISGGSGSSNIYNAKRMNADLYVTGDLSYHYAHDVLAIGLNALDIGHNIEKFFVYELKNTLKNISKTIYVNYVKKRYYFNTKTVIFQLSNINFQLSWQKSR